MSHIHMHTTKIHHCVKFKVSTANGITCYGHKEIRNTIMAIICLCIILRNIYLQNGKHPGQNGVDIIDISKQKNKYGCQIDEIG